MKTALVTGGTGTIGPILVEHLKMQGYQVRVLARSTPKTNLLPDDVQFIKGDINNLDSVRSALRDVDTVFHLAALLHIENPKPELAHEYQRINVEGTRTVAKQAQEAGVKRFIYFSTVKVYGIHQAEPVTEEIVPQPRTMYAKTKLAGEKAALDIEGLETIILRLSAVFSGHLQGSWKRLVKATSQGWFIPIGNLKNIRSLTYGEDVARAAILVSESANRDGNVYNVVGYEQVTMQEILEAIYGTQDKTMPKLRLPSAPLLTSVGLAERIFALIGKRLPVTSEVLQQFVEDETYSGQKLRLLGFTPRFSLNEGWRNTIATLNL